MNNKSISISDKFLLSFEEASTYFGIGINKLRAMAQDSPDWCVWNGQRRLIKREKLEKYLLNVTSF